MKLQANDQLMLSVGALLVALLALSFGDAVIKLLDAQFTLWQIFVVRSGVAFPILVAITLLRHRRDRFNQLRLIATGWVVARSLCVACAGVSYFGSLLFIPFSTAAAVFSVAPLCVVVFAAAAGGERLTKFILCAIAIGFMGMLLILRPQVAGFNFYALLSLLGAVFYSAAMVITRIKCRDENPYAMAIALNVVLVVVGILFTAVMNWLALTPTNKIAQLLFGQWQTMQFDAWIMMGVLGLVFIAFTICAVVAYQKSRAAAVAPFEYAYLAFGILWGGVMFAERPDFLALIGMAMIVLAGLIAMRQKSTQS